MSNQLVQLLHQSEINRVILSTIAKHDGKVGVFTAEDVETLTPEIVSYMKDVVEDMCLALKALNEVFIEKNVTSDCSINYVNFLSDLLPQYLAIDSHEEVSKLSLIEIEAIVNASTTNTSIEEMRSGLAENHYMKQDSNNALTADHINAQFAELDDGTIIEAFKTLLMKQYQHAVNTPAQ